MGINHTVMNPGWVTAHQRTHEGPSVHERDPLMWVIALFRFINCVIGNEGNFKYIDWNVSLENIMTFNHYGFTNLHTWSGTERNSSRSGSHSTFFGSWPDLDPFPESWIWSGTDRVISGKNQFSSSSFDMYSFWEFLPPNQNKSSSSTS